MLSIMTDTKRALATRMEAARAVMPFCHARLKETVHFIEQGQPITVELLAEGKRARFTDGEL
jgi:hypothetical protein